MAALQHLLLSQADPDWAETESTSDLNSYEISLEMSPLNEAQPKWEKGAFMKTCRRGMVKCDRWKNKGQ